MGSDRYLLFAGDQYYPQQAWDDFKGTFSDALEAEGAGKTLMKNHDWWHVVDLETLGVVRNGTNQIYGKYPLS